MVNRHFVLVAVLIACPAPGHALRDDTILSGGGDGIEERLAVELFRQAQFLQKAVSHWKQDPRMLSVGERDLFWQNYLFAKCGLSDSDVHELAGAELQLRSVGKLAKSGDFLASTDNRWLVKKVAFGEKSKLTELGTVKFQETEYSNCHGFSQSLLLPIPLTFLGWNTQPYLVMRNETDRLATLTLPEWQVTQSFDVKPLPNLSEQLAYLVMTLSIGWLASFAPLSKWDGWHDVKNALQSDCHLLTSYNVVDFSLFVNVLRRTSVAHESSPSISAHDGCVAEPSQAAIVCFAVLDYLVDFSKGRKFESSLKGYKFQVYGEKMMHAFACIGDLSGNGCQAYHDYGTIRSASNTEAKAALLGSETFRQNYECQVERPKLRYAHTVIVAGGLSTSASVKVMDEPADTVQDDFTHKRSYEVVQMLPEVLHSNRPSYDGTGYDANIASWLQEAASSINGGHVVASGFEQLLERGLQQPEKGFQLHEEELAACKQGIESFATNSFWGHANNKDLGNVVWSPRLNSIFVVRGKNKFYSNSDVVTKMRKQHCFMLVRFFRCKALNGKRSIFDYKTSFGPIEVLQVMPSASSGDDFKVFRNMTSRPAKRAAE